MSLNFDEFITSLLERCNLKQTTIDDILSNKKYHKLLEQSFTHKSYDLYNNYEKIETIGDVTLSLAIVNYVVKKYPSIKTAGELSNIKNNLISSSSFATFAKISGFYPYIKIGDLKDDFRTKLLERMRDVKYYNDLFNNKIDDYELNLINQVEAYRKLLTDSFEAFCGTIQTIIDDRAGVEVGPGYAVCYAFISSYLDDIKIPIKFEDTLNSIAYIKRIYDSNDWPRLWPSGVNKTVFTITEKSKIIKDDDGQDKELKWFESIYITYLPLSISPLNKGRVILGTGVGLSKDVAQTFSAIESIKILKEKYGITNINKRR